jgi:cytochrome c biogenesis protein CcmG/thiol:disulfide interchange protein DsbE
MKRRSVAVIATMAAMGLLLPVLARGRVHPLREAQPAAAQAQKDGAVIRFVKNPTPAPPFQAQDLDGNVVATAAWHGKVTLLNFWATWCGPCRAEIPTLILLQKEFGDRLQVIGIAVDEDSPEEVRQFVRKMGINYRIVMGTPQLQAQYGGIAALPTSFVADSEGRIVQKHVGLYPASVFEQEIRSLLGMPVDATVETFEDTGQVFLKNAKNATELPGVDLAHLTPQQKHAALRRMNAENCTCGCGLTIAQCRINDSTCPTSRELAAKIVAAVLHGSGPSPSTSLPK